MCVKKIDYEVVKNLIRGVGRIIRFRLSNQFLAKGCSRMIFATFGQSKGHINIWMIFATFDRSKVGINSRVSFGPFALQKNVYYLDIQSPIIYNTNHEKILPRMS